MAVFALLNGFAHVDGHDFSCDVNQMEADISVDDLQVTTMCSDGWTELIGGLRRVRFDMAGFWQADGTTQVDDVAFAALGDADKVFTIGNVNTETEPCYLFQAGHVNYKIFGEHGQAAPFALSSTGTNGVGMVRGQLALKKSTVNATGAAGSVVQLGAASASEYLYATLHVFPTAGTTITVQVQSDSSAGFPSPTTQATIGPITTTGGSWMTRVAGAITDTHYRLNVSAVTGTFTAAGAIGIGS